MSIINDIVYNFLIEEGIVPEDAEAHRFRLISRDEELIVKIDIYGGEG